MKRHRHIPKSFPPFHASRVVCASICTSDSNLPIEIKQFGKVLTVLIHHGRFSIFAKLKTCLNSINDK